MLKVTVRRWYGSRARSKATRCGQDGTAQKVNDEAEGHDEDRARGCRRHEPAVDLKLVILVMVDEPTNFAPGRTWSGPPFKKIRLHSWSIRPRHRPQQATKADVGDKNPQREDLDDRPASCWPRWMDRPPSHIISLCYRRRRGGAGSLSVSRLQERLHDSARQRWTRWRTRVERRLDLAVAQEPAASAVNGDGLDGPRPSGDQPAGRDRCIM